MRSEKPRGLRRENRNCEVQYISDPISVRLICVIAGNIASKFYPNAFHFPRDPVPGPVSDAALHRYALKALKNKTKKGEQRPRHLCRLANRLTLPESTVKCCHCGKCRRQLPPSSKFLVVIAIPTILLYYPQNGSITRIPRSHIRLTKAHRWSFLQDCLYSQK